MKIAYGACVGSWEQFGSHVAPHVDGRCVIALAGQTSIAAAYRGIVAAAVCLDVDALVLQHVDLEIVGHVLDAEAKIIAAIEAGADLVGVAGGGSDSGIAWWNQAPIGHQRTDVREIDFGARSGDVQCLEGSLIAMSRWAMEHTAFDQQYPGFHGYDADIGRQCWTYGRRVTVVDFDTWHHTQMGFKSQQSHEDWLAADKIFRAKWGLS